MKTPKVGWHLSEEEIQALANSNGGLEWERVKESIRHSRGDELPPDWFETVIASGLIEDQIATWEAKTFPPEEWGYPNGNPTGTR